MSSELEPTKEERAWLRRAQALLDSIPDKCWVFQTTNGLNLMRVGKDDKPVVLAARGRVGGGYDSERVVGKAQCRHGKWIDGGDW